MDSSLFEVKTNNKHSPGRGGSGRPGSGRPSSAAQKKNNANNGLGSFGEEDHYTSKAFTSIT
jgi:hypothetical protein